jgi:hypothetical protein
MFPYMTGSHFWCGDLCPCLSAREMICVLLVASHGGRLEEELLAVARGPERHSAAVADRIRLAGVPKPLLPVAADGRCALDLWWAAVAAVRCFTDGVYLVTNAARFKHVERWATARGFPVDRIINDGATSDASRYASPRMLVCRRVSQWSCCE